MAEPNPSEQIEVANQATSGREPGTGAQAPATPVPQRATSADDFDDDEMEFDPELDGIPQRAKKAPSEAAKSDGTPAEPPPTPSAAAAAQPEAPPLAPRQRHPRLLRQEALEYGATPQQIDAAATDDLEDWVEYQRAESRRQQQRQPAAAAEPDFDLGIDESLYEPDLINAIKRLGKSQAEEIKQLKQQLTVSQQREAQRQAQSTGEAIDGAFESLADSRYGTGSAVELQPGSSEMKLRGVLLGTAGIDFNNPPPPRVLAKKLREAHELIYGKAPAPADEPPPASPSPTKPAPPKNPVNGQFVKPADAEKQAREEAWVRAGLAQPTQRNGAAEPKGPKRAAKAVAAHLREKFYDEDEENDLPD